MNPLYWPLWGKLAGVFAVIALAAAGGSYWALSRNPVTYHPSTATTPEPSASSPTPDAQAASGLTAGCEVGFDTSPGTTGGFVPASQQALSAGYETAYQITVTNNTGSAVTVYGFAVEFSAYGSSIGTTSPTVQTTLMEPGENWDFTEDIGTGGVMVSDATFLNETCAVQQVHTASGLVNPSNASEPNGEQNTRTLDIQQAQNQLAKDVNTLESESATLNTDKSLAQAVDQMQSEYQTEQQEYQTEQQDTGTCGVSGDASAVGGDASAMGGYLNALDNAVSYLQQTEIAAVKTDLSNVASDLTALRNYGATPDTSTSAAVATGNNALASAASAISWADGQGSTINGEAQSLATTAQNYASAHSC